MLIRKVTGGMFWTFAERFFAQGVTAVVAIVLARLLTPDDYGIISIVMVFISIADVFATSGIGSALVQKKEISPIDYDSAFHLNMMISIVIYAVVFWVAPFVGAFYNMDILMPVIRVMGIRIPIAAANSIQQAYVRREMKFRFFFFATLGGTVISGIVGIAFALLEAGVWALVAQYLTNVIIDTAVLFLLNGWRPSLRFSCDSAKNTLSFGWKILVAELIGSFGNRLKILVSGRAFSAADIAYYEQGNRYPSLLTTNVNAAINQVMFPVFSRSQENPEQMQQMLRKTVQIGLFFLNPILIGFAATSDSFVRVFLTEKWIECVPYVKIFCLYFLTRPLESATTQALQAIGRADLGLYKIIVVNISTFICLFVSIFYFHSIFVLACTSLFTMAVSMIINMYFVHKILNYRILDQFYDLMLSILPAAMMGGIVILIGYIELPVTIIFGIQIICGVVSYTIFAMIFNQKSFNYVCNYFWRMKTR